MCTNYQIVKNRYNNSLYEVPCRYCVECLIDKSNLYRNMLLAFKSSNYNMVLCNLTYDNYHVPYLRLTELEDMFVSGEVPSVHRDIDYRRFRSHGKLKTKLYYNTLSPWNPSKFNDLQQILGLPRLVKSHRNNSKVVFFNDRVGVLYFVDVQRLLKSLRHHIPGFEYFCCGEYGSEQELYRPHWHLLFYLPKHIDVRYFRSLVIRYWPLCSTKNLRIFQANACETYVTMYITKFSKYPSSLHRLQNRYVHYSRAVGRSLLYNISQLDDTFHYNFVKNGLLLSKLPSTREFNIMMPIRKIPHIPITWHSVFMTFHAPQFRRCYHPFRKLPATLSDQIEFSIRCAELHTALASQRLKDYLLENPTIFSNHKLKMLNEYAYVRTYGVKPTPLLRNFLRSYNEQHQKNISLYNRYQNKYRINNLIYKTNEY